MHVTTHHFSQWYARIHITLKHKDAKCRLPFTDVHFNTRIHAYVYMYCVTCVCTCVNNKACETLAVQWNKNIMYAQDNSSAIPNMKLCLCCDGGQTCSATNIRLTYTLKPHTALFGWKSFISNNGPQGANNNFLCYMQVCVIYWWKGASWLPWQRCNECSIPREICEMCCISLIRMRNDSRQPC